MTGTSPLCPICWYDQLEESLTKYFNDPNEVGVVYDVDLKNKYINGSIFIKNCYAADILLQIWIDYFWKKQTKKNNS